MLIIVLFFAIITTTIFILKRERYKPISEMQEQTILFVRTEYEWQSKGEYRIKALDNQGNIYYLYTNRSLDKVLNEGLLTEEHIVSKISADEIGMYYDMVCDMKSKRAQILVNGTDIPEATRYYYYGVQYIENEVIMIEVYCCGMGSYINESEYAEEVLNWMRTWEWKDDTK